MLSCRSSTPGGTGSATLSPARVAIYTSATSRVTCWTTNRRPLTVWTARSIPGRAVVWPVGFVVVARSEAGRDHPNPRDRSRTTGRTLSARVQPAGRLLRRALWRTLVATSVGHTQRAVQQLIRISPRCSGCRAETAREGGVVLRAGVAMITPTGVVSVPVLQQIAMTPRASRTCAQDDHLRAPPSTITSWPTTLISKIHKDKSNMIRRIKAI